MPTVSGIVVGTGVQGSNRRTLLDVVDELARPLDASDTTLRAMAADAFRAAVRTMNRKGLWPWEVQEENVVITANQKYSTVSSAVKKPLRMHKTVSSGGNEDEGLAYYSFDRFKEKFNLDTSGDPWAYTIPNLFETGQVRWYPVPSSNDTANFTYYRVTPAPRAEDETIEIPDYAMEVYMAYAWYEFLKRVPASQQRFPLQLAMADARLAFRELSVHVASPGDRMREVIV